MSLFSNLLWRCKLWESFSPAEVLTQRPPAIDPCCEKVEWPARGTLDVVNGNMDTTCWKPLRDHVRKSGGIVRKQILSSRAIEKNLRFALEHFQDQASASQHRFIHPISFNAKFPIAQWKESAGVMWKIFLQGSLRLSPPKRGSSINSAFGDVRNKN